MPMRRRNGHVVVNSDLRRHESVSPSLSPALRPGVHRPPRRCGHSFPSNGIPIAPVWPQIPSPVRIAQLAALFRLPNASTAKLVARSPLRSRRSMSPIATRREPRCGVPVSCTRRPCRVRRRLSLRVFLLHRSPNRCLDREHEPSLPFRPRFDRRAGRDRSTAERFSLHRQSSCLPRPTPLEPSPR